ncbi:MAG: sulfite oxidase-like oxidoreductase [Chloroflexi bacterium]|nr:sulfite oxidase-like oxidoreductase [Chloroflexota bacterium]
MLKKLGRLTEIKQDREGQSAPPGQYLTKKFPVLTFGPTPKIDLKDWKFKVSGLVEKEFELDWKQFTGLPKLTLDAEFHCVTQWSKLENTWEGIAYRELVKLIKVKPEAKYAMVHCYGGYSTNVSLEVLDDDDVLFAYRHDGEDLPAEHGGPMRLVVPKRYGWKSAKWVNGIEFMEKDKPGFWEARGYHMEGDPWKEERFWDDL